MQTRRSADQWRKLIDKFERSGMTQDHFCRREGLATATFSEWRRKLSASSLATIPASFVEVCLPNTPAPIDSPQPGSVAEVVVELPFGVVLRLRGFKA